MFVLVTVFSFAAVAEEPYLEEYENLKKEPMQAALMSLAIPAGGYYYAENYNKSKLYGGIELAALLAYVTMRDYQDSIALGYVAIKAYNIYGSYKEAKNYNENLKEKLKFKPQVDVDLERERIGLSLVYEF